jgi:DNA polymerase/3'-5' exonuclease PolX
MNSTSITDYILKLEKLNDESRTKIEQLKKLLNEANEEKVEALNKLNDSLYQKTARVTDKTVRVVTDENTDLVEYLLALSESANDRFKSIAYHRGAEVVADLPYEVLSGESLLDLKGIGKSIASKIDEFLEEQDPDYEESIASNDYESDESDESDEYFISHNHDIYIMLMNVAGTEHDSYKRQAYTNAASKIYHLPYAITSGEEAMKLPGVGKSIAKKIDDFLKVERNSELAQCFLKLGNLEPSYYKSEAYWIAEEKLRELDFEVTRSEDVKNIKGFGPSICAKIDEFMETGTMKRLEELSRT